MKKIVYMCLALACAFSVKGQDGAVNQVVGSQNLENISRGVAIRSFDNRYEGVKGSPFMFEDWGEADITLVGGKEFKNLKTKLDLYNGAVYILRGDQVILVNDNIAQILFIDSNRLFKPEASVDGYVEVLAEGEITLYAKRWKRMVEANYKGPYPSGRKYDEYVDKIDYYYLTKGNKPEKIKLKKKDIEAIFPIKGNQFDSIVKKENLNLKEEKDIVKLLKNYNNGLY